MNRILIVLAALGFFAVFSFVSYLPAKSAPPQKNKMMSMPSELDVSTTRTTYSKKYIVSFTSNLDPIAINKIHSWEVLLKTPDGAPVNDAKITIIGGMPMHHHGMPTAPRVTKNLGQGKYLLEGMKFSMTGWWELKIQIDAGTQQDNVTFNLILK